MRFKFSIRLGGLDADFLSSIINSSVAKAGAPGSSFFIPMCETIQEKRFPNDADGFTFKRCSRLN